MRLLDREERAGHHQLDRLGLADQPGQPLRAAGAGQHAERHFRQADLAGALAGDPQVGGHRHLEPAADTVPVQRRDHQLGRLLESVHRLVGVQAEVVLERRIGVLEHADVGAGAEELLAGADEHDHVDRGVHARRQYRVVELAHHLVRVGVGRRVVQLEHRHAVGDRG